MAFQSIRESQNSWEKRTGNELEQWGGKFDLRDFGWYFAGNSGPSRLSTSYCFYKQLTLIAEVFDRKQRCTITKAAQAMGKAVHQGCSKCIFVGKSGIKNELQKARLLLGRRLLSINTRIPRTGDSRRLSLLCALPSQQH